MKRVTTVLLLQALIFSTAFGIRQKRPLFSPDNSHEQDQWEDDSFTLENTGRPKQSRADDGNEPDEILDKQAAELEEGFVAEDGAKFREDIVCMDKEMTISEIQYDDEVRCNHVSYKNCYQAYKTVYKPQECEVCKDNFKKECFIEYEDVAKTEVVRICSSKAERVCRDINAPVTGKENTTCTTIYQTICETKYHHYDVTDQSANCTIVKEKVKFNEKDSRGKITVVEREVPTTKCDVSNKDLNKSFPETKCTKKPCEVCGPEWCPIVTSEKCEDKEKTFVTPVPKERCELKPYKICNIEVISLPSLEQVNECVDVPKEVCSVEQVNPRPVDRKINKQWCTSVPDPDPEIEATDCEFYYKRDPQNYKPGVYKIRSPIGTIWDCFCSSEGYTVIQMRGPSQYKSDYFSLRVWEEYKAGFGTLGTEFWMGLQKIYLLSNSKNYKLRVTMTDFNGRIYEAVYDTFKLKENSKYTLSVDHYHGDAGNALQSHSGAKFSTRDNDNDGNPALNCASNDKGAWWYPNSCNLTVLNGDRDSGLTWEFTLNNEILVRQLKTVVMAIKEVIPAKDCEDYFIKDPVNFKEGIYRITSPNGADIWNVYCTRDGYTVIQRRVAPSDLSADYFSRSVWKEYQDGFGNLNNEFWLGLDKIYALTNSGEYGLRILMEANNKTKFEANYEGFKLLDNSSYTLRVNTYYTGAEQPAGDGLTFHTGEKFSTVDKDNDFNCAQVNRGAWWYTNHSSLCHRSNLNGNRDDGLSWMRYLQLKTVVMAIKKFSGRSRSGESSPLIE